MGGQDAETGLAQIRQSLARFVISLGQQIAKEVKGRFYRKLLAGSGEKTLPERAGRALFAVAEEGPAHVGLVVLGLGQGKREQQDEPLMLERPRPRGQVGGPVRILPQL